jgi:hypothetical protein
VFMALTYYFGRTVGPATGDTGLRAGTLRGPPKAVRAAHIPLALNRLYEVPLMQRSRTLAQAIDT